MWGVKYEKSHNVVSQKLESTMKRKKVGEEAYERLLKADDKQGVVDTQREVDKTYMEQIKLCVENHRSWDKPWYIVVQLKKEQLMENVIRRYFIGRLSLPTPQWDQTVWRYDPKTGDLRFLWVLPDEQTAQQMAAGPDKVDPEQRHLLQFVLDFLDKKLYGRFHKTLYNGEKECDVSDSPYSDLCAKAAQVSSDLSVGTE